MSALILLVLAQTAATQAAKVPTTTAQIARPFAVGESITFDASYTTFFGVGLGGDGSATLAVQAIDTVRGVPSFRFYFATSVSHTLLKQKTESISWTGVDDFISRRYVKNTSAKSAHTRQNQDFAIYPDSQFYRRTTELGVDTFTNKTPKLALDDIAFVYFLRMQPLKVGETVVYHDRYFRSAIGNISVKALRKETIQLKDKTRVLCWVLQPVVNEENGLFRKGADAKIWITDDGRRLPVRIEAGVAGVGGTLKLNAIKIVRP